MLQRIIGVFKLDKNTFMEIEQDKTATTQAFIVVLLVGLVAGISAAVGAVAFNQAAPGLMESLEGTLGEGIDLAALPQMSPVGGFINGLVGAILSWLVWSVLTYFVGSKLFGATTDMSEMMRVIGFAQAPRLLSLLGFIPCLGGILSLVGWLWSLMASFIGIREGLDLDTGKTALTIIIAFIGAVIVSFLVGLILAPIFAL